MRLKPLICGLAAALGLVSCELVSSLTGAVGDFLHKDEVVARLGQHKLYRPELEAALPDGLPVEDSLALARQYIHGWAADMILLDLAQKQLSKEELDVSRAVEEYKISLLKYRYEQRYVNERLDTAVSTKEISAYYEAHPEKFVLRAPIAKGRYLCIGADSPHRATIRKKMGSGKVDEVVEADSLAARAALKYFDYTDTWVDAAAFSDEFGMSTTELVAALRGGVVERTDELGHYHLACITELLREGRTAPLDYCSGRIREIILNTRKHAMLAGLEQDLLKDAADKQKLVIY